MIDIISRGMASVAITQIQALNEYVTTQLVKIDLIKIVSELPETGEENKIYLVPKNEGENSEQDYYDEYIWVNKGTETEAEYGWEFVASRAYNIDLSTYATMEYVESEISKNDIIRTEYKISSITETYEIEGEVINVDMIDSVTSEVVLGNVKTEMENSITKVTVSFSAVPINPIIVVIFSTK